MALDGNTENRQFTSYKEMLLFIDGEVSGCERHFHETFEHPKGETPCFFGNRQGDNQNLIIKMTKLLYGEKTDYSQNQLENAIFLYTWLFYAQAASLAGPDECESWMVRRRVLKRYSKAIKEGRFTEEQIGNATRLALEHMYLIDTPFSERSREYLKARDEMNRRLQSIREYFEDSARTVDRDGIEQYFRCAELWKKRGHSVWTAEWMEELTRLFEEYEPSLFSDPSAVYFQPRNALEFLMLVRKNKNSNVNVIWTEIPCTRIYSKYASALIDLELFQEAREALKKAERWNPVSGYIFNEMAFLELRLEHNAAEEYIQLAFNYCHIPDEMAAAYRKLAFLRVEQKRWMEAMACCQLSEALEPGSQSVSIETAYIEEMGKVKKMPWEEAIETAKKNGIHLGVNPEWMVILLELMESENVMNDKQYRESMLDFARGIAKIMNIERGNPPQ